MATFENTSKCELSELFQISKKLNLNQDEKNIENKKLNLIQDNKKTIKKIKEYFKGQNVFTHIKYTFNSDNLDDKAIKKELIDDLDHSPEGSGFTYIKKDDFKYILNKNNKLDYDNIKNINYFLIVVDLDENGEPVKKDYLDDIQEYYLKNIKNPFILSSKGGYSYINNNNEKIAMIENGKIYGFNKIDDIFYNLFYKSIKYLNQNELLIMKLDNIIKINIFNFLNFSNHKYLRYKFNYNEGEKCEKEKIISIKPRRKTIKIESNLKNIFFSPSKMETRHQEEERKNTNILLLEDKKNNNKKILNFQDMPDDIKRLIFYEKRRIVEKDKKIFILNRFYKKNYNRVLNELNKIIYESKNYYKDYYRDESLEHFLTNKIILYLNSFLIKLSFILIFFKFKSILLL